MQALTRGSSLVLAALVALVVLAGCAKNDEEMARAHVLTGGDARRGAVLLRQYGCGACHTIPGIPGAHTSVGPNLAGLRERMFIAGVLPNDPGNLAAWIRNPQAFAPRTAMPYLGVPETDARDIATYLYSIR